ncbi:MAG: DUF1801 domain-containing protein [Nannocystis sp.]|nr:DUF1801 domain-containing protein [Nannocystis sp.]
MQSKAKTVPEYLDSLPEERRRALSALRETILANLDADIEEGVQYGMIGYYVPHRIYPAGYHCDPKQPLPFAGIASQKNHMSLYLSCVYEGDGDGEAAAELAWLREAWAKAGKRLDMGKACVRFKKLEDLPLEVIAALLRRVTAAVFVKRYEIDRARAAAAKKAAKTTAARRGGESARR